MTLTLNPINLLDGIVLNFFNKEGKLLNAVTPRALLDGCMLLEGDTVIDWNISLFESHLGNHSSYLSISTRRSCYMFSYNRKTERFDILDQTKFSDLFGWSLQIENLEIEEKRNSEINTKITEDGTQT